MHLRCTHCHHAVTVPAGLARYSDLPVRCHVCRRVFTVPPQRLRDNVGPPARQLDRSVSARRHHHPIRCPACAATLRLPGRSAPAVAVNLSCPQCGAGFRHLPHRRGDGLDILIGIVGGAVLALGLVLLAHVTGYIELRNLATAPHLARIATLLADIGIR